VIKTFLGRKKKITKELSISAALPSRKVLIYKISRAGCTDFPKIQEPDF